MARRWAWGLLGAAIISNPAAAQDATQADNPPPADGVVEIGTAKALIAAGNLAPARAILERILAGDPANIEGVFLLGMIALAEGDHPRAIGLFRNALDRKPDATRIRLELARTLFLEKQDESADYHFRLAIAEHPPESVIRNIARFREAIRARRAWRFNLTFAIAPDSNINSATAKEQVDIFGLPFTLDRAARARSGTGFIVGGDASIRLLRDRKVPVYLAAFGRIVRYPDHRFDDIYVGAEAGPEFRLSGGRFRVSATALERWYGGRHLVTSLGGRINFDKVIAGNWELETSLAARRNAYSGRADIDGWDMEASLAANHAISPSTLGFAYAVAQRSVVNDPGQSYWAARLGFGVLKEIGWGLRPKLALELGRQINDVPLVLFGRTRRDWRFQATAGIYKRDWSVAGFAPTLRLTWTRTLSTVSLYDQKRMQAEFGITKAF